MVSKKLEEVVIKTLAAFANGQGGTLLIGVDDSGAVLGLDNDYHALGGANRDKLELHLGSRTRKSGMPCDNSWAYNLLSPVPEIPKIITTSRVGKLKKACNVISTFYTF